MTASADIKVTPALAARRSVWSWLQSFREVVILGVIAALVVGMGVYDAGFVAPGHLHAILLGLAVEAMVAVGMTVLLVAGGFDLSVGATAALAGMITARLLTWDWPVAAAIGAGLLGGVAVGVGNGLIIARMGINPFVTTLATMGIVRGLVLGVSDTNLGGLPAGFKWIGQGTTLGVQHPVLIAAVLVVAGDVLLRKHRFFRQNYYIGGNERAALLSGISVQGLTIFNYALVGGLAALAGIVHTARLGSATVDAQQGLELRVITAVIVGGASLKGGEGTVAGAFLGALLMAVVVGALTFLTVPANWQTLVIGATLLGAVMVDTVAKKMQAK